MCEEEFKKMNEVFNKYILIKCLFVMIKLGVILDGKIVMFLLDSKWIIFIEVR